MPIEKRQPGEAAAAAKAGTIVGQSEKAKREEARAEQARQQQVAIKAREKAEQRAMEWELQKMQMRSEQDFAQELRMKQYDLDKFNRAKEWDIEKMELASRIDFEMEEKERVRDIERIQNDIAGLKEAKTDGLFTGREFEWEDFMTRKLAELYSVKNPSKSLSSQERLLDQAARDGGGPTVAGETAKPLTDVGGFPLPVPTVDTLTAQHVHAAKVQQKKVFVVDTFDNTLQQVPIENEAETLKLARYKEPKIVGTPMSKPRRTQYPEDPTGMIEAFDRFNTEGLFPTAKERHEAKRKKNTFDF